MNQTTHTTLAHRLRFVSLTLLGALGTAACGVDSSPVETSPLAGSPGAGGLSTDLDTSLAGGAATPGGAGASSAGAGSGDAVAGTQGAGDGTAGAGSMAGAGMGTAGAGVGMAGAGVGMAGAGVGMAGAGVGMAGAGTGMAGAGTGMAGAGTGMAGAGAMGMAGAGVTDDMGEGGAGMDTTDPDMGDDTMDPTTGVEGGYPENSGAACQSSAGALASNPNLPDPFAMNDGTRISTMAEWACRRDEIKKDIEKYEIGEKPEPPSVEASIAGGKLNVVVTTDAGSLTLSSTVGSASGSGPSCVVIGMNGNSSMVSGCVQVPFMHDQVVGYNQNGQKSQNDPYYKVYPDKWDKIGNYSAWSWGISRLIDGLEQVQDELNIDMTKIAVHGCSYAGKMALFGGAFDERVALTIAQESGGGGINSWRTSQDFADRGTNIEKIDNTNYSWFMQSMKNLDPYSLPHDHHELIAMIAPRAVIALGNRDYEWLGDESGYKSMMAALEVWKAMGVEERIGFDFTTGHAHCSAAPSQVTSVNAFVDKYLKDKDVDTAIRIEPPANGFDLDYTKVIDWETPTLQ